MGGVSRDSASEESLVELQPPASFFQDAHRSAPAPVQWHPSAAQFTTARQREEDPWLVRFQWARAEARSATPALEDARRIPSISAVFAPRRRPSPTGGPAAAKLPYVLKRRAKRPSSAGFAILYEGYNTTDNPFSIPPPVPAPGSTTFITQAAPCQGPPPQQAFPREPPLAALKSVPASLRRLHTPPPPPPEAPGPARKKRDAAAALAQSGADSVAGREAGRQQLQQQQQTQGRRLLLLRQQQQQPQPQLQQQQQPQQARRQDVAAALEKKLQAPASDAARPGQAVLHERILQHYHDAARDGGPRSLAVCGAKELAGASLFLQGQSAAPPQEAPDAGDPWAAGAKDPFISFEVVLPGNSLQQGFAAEGSEPKSPSSWSLLRTNGCPQLALKTGAAGLDTGGDVASVRGSMPASTRLEARETPPLCSPANSSHAKRRGSRLESPNPSPSNLSRQRLYSVYKRQAPPAHPPQPRKATAPWIERYPAQSLNDICDLYDALVVGQRKPWDAVPPTRLRFAGFQPLAARVLDTNPSANGVPGEEALQFFLSTADTTDPSTGEPAATLGAFVEAVKHAFPGMVASSTGQKQAVKSPGGAAAARVELRREVLEAEAARLSFTHSADQVDFLQFSQGAGASKVGVELRANPFTSLKVTQRSICRKLRHRRGQPLRPIGQQPQSPPLTIKQSDEQPSCAPQPMWA
ncbi:hypothetical protein DIPPA_14111 [Diplonema papillatum]|nr:hypothetical protein DIPPA_14111 [Diplonema papillatum]